MQTDYSEFVCLVGYIFGPNMCVCVYAVDADW